MTNHNIKLNIHLDNENMPEHIDWEASGGTAEAPSPAKAFLLSIWDPQEKTALKIDLWTKKMMVDEMNDFFFQTLMTMSDTFLRATRNEELSGEMKEFAKNFKKKADAKLMADEAKK